MATKTGRSLVELKDLTGENVQQMTIRVSAALYQRIAEGAAASGNQLSREVVSSLSEHYHAIDNGACLTFDPELRRRLDLVADILGTARSSLVQMLVVEGLPKLLQKAIDLRAESDEATRKLDTIDAAPTPTKKRT